VPARASSIAAAIAGAAGVACSHSSSHPVDASPDAGSNAIALTVGVDTNVTSPSGLATLPDEHTSFLPVGPSNYLVFAATSTAASGPDKTGAIVFRSSDLSTFTLANGYGQTALGGLVFVAPSAFTDCSFSGPGSFDQNYAAPGGVVHDPTLPAGNQIMVYEAEQHCFGGQYDFNYFATIGLARSSDGGVTWPASGAADRYAILQVPGAKPTATPAPPEGDAIPTAFVDDVASGHYLYVVYENQGASTIQPDGYLRVARTQLGASGPLAFSKWNQGQWTEPGIGGLDSAMTPTRGCGDSGFQDAGQISYVDALHLYVLTFVCVTLQQTSPGTYVPVQGSWYFSTATSLATQDWSPPQLIDGSTAAVTAAPTASCPAGAAFDGWYPSFVTPGSANGHLGQSGLVFFLDGCNGGTSGRVFSSRTFAFH